MSTMFCPACYKDWGLTKELTNQRRLAACNMAGMDKPKPSVIDASTKFLSRLMHIPTLL